jgi:hypothetical protein
MISDPAWGKNKAQRSGAVGPVNRVRNTEFRNINVGQYSGPRASYQRYNVSEQAQDILNRQNRSYNK